MIQKLAPVAVLRKYSKSSSGPILIPLRPKYSQFIEKKLSTFKTKHPTVQFDIKLLKGYKHPYIRGEYGSDIP